MGTRRTEGGRRPWGAAASGLLLAATALWPQPAAAHLGLDFPPSRHGDNVLKDGPCGRAGSERGETVAVFAPGETLTVRWREYIDHPGHYRIAFDPDGDDDLADPICVEGCDGRSPVFGADTPGVLILADFIPDRDTTPMYEVEVTLPDVECETCTLQVIQVMYDKPPQTSPGNDVYYQCSDIALRRDAVAPDGGAPGRDAGATMGGDASATPGPDGGAGSRPGPVRPGDPPAITGGCAVGSPGLRPWWLLTAAAVLWGRRRRPRSRR